MSTHWTYLINLSVTLILLRICPGQADVAHFFAAPSEIGNFLHDPVAFSAATLYAAPPTPAPVAPVPAVTTEFSLPEIVENRNVKSLHQPHANFIPLSQHYLPPVQEQRPSYESPKPSDDFAGGYYYPQPSASTTRLPSTTTTPRPIVVHDSGEEQLELEHLPAPGYDYHAPPRPQRPSTPAPVYLPPTESSHTEQLRLRLKDMRCLQLGYFRAVLKLDGFLGTEPVVDKDEDQGQNKHCELKVSRSFLLLDIPGTDFERCGVRSCGQDLCVRLRFPAIRGLRTGGDSILTLHCKTQERTAVKTHSLKMGVTNEVQSRSIGSYAHGGNQYPFRTHVELLRRGTNGYTRQLENNGAVELGEELLLRAHVLSGDGWNHTKLSDVQLQRVSGTGEILNSAQLITSRGCLNPVMQSVCTHPPNFEPPLGQRLHFRAIMFPGMHSGDSLILSMRITGCLEREDCQLTAQDCQQSAVAPQSSRRRRRQIKGNATEAFEVSQLSFRVIMPSLQEREQGEERGAGGAEVVIVDNVANEKVAEVSRSMALMGSLGFVLLLLGMAIIVIYKLGT